MPFWITGVPLSCCKLESIQKLFFPPSQPNGSPWDVPWAARVALGRVPPSVPRGGLAAHRWFSKASGEVRGGAHRLGVSSLAAHEVGRAGVLAGGRVEM